MANIKKGASRKLNEVVRRPTVYTFNFKDAPLDSYKEPLNVLFSNPDFIKIMEQRNRMVESAARLRQGSSELLSLIRTVEAKDRQLADAMFATLVQANVHAAEQCNYLTFSTLLKYYVDYSAPDAQDRVMQLTNNLYKLTFLADMLESVTMDIKEEMTAIFGGNFQFQQFDTILTVLSQLMSQMRGFFQSTRNAAPNSKESDLYIEYADSINDYLAKRMKTYVDRLGKIHPALRVYEAGDMVKAVNKFFGAEGLADDGVIARTDRGGFFIDCAPLLPLLNDLQQHKLDQRVAPLKKGATLSDRQIYSFAVTDAIMKEYE